MDTQHVAFCCIERCNPLTTTWRLWVVNFFQEQKGMDWRYLGVFCLTKNLGARAKNLGSYASQGSNSSICPFSPIDSRGRVVILLNICVPTRPTHRRPSLIRTVSMLDKLERSCSLRVRSPIMRSDSKPGGTWTLTSSSPRHSRYALRDGSSQATGQAPLPFEGPHSLLPWPPPPSTFSLLGGQKWRVPFCLTELCRQPRWTGRLKY
jgi:hypothetical protein